MELLIDKHAAFVKKFALVGTRTRILSACYLPYFSPVDLSRMLQEKDTFLYYATEHFRMSGVYWGVTTLQLVGRENYLDKDEIVSWVLQCQHANGGFRGSERHDAHLLYTYSAVQILALYDKLDSVDADKIAEYVASMQLEDGSFQGDEWGEVDTRFSYCALACCSLLQRLHVLDTQKAADYVLKCQNFDGGFGITPGNESHTGQIFTCVAALSIAGCLDRLDRDRLCWWLCERQTPCGGLNGRPEKQEDVCYTWWCMTALKILDRMDWIDSTALSNFILSCQDENRGGISDRAEDECDVYHTFFGIAGLSLLGYPGIERIDPVYALPSATVERCLQSSQKGSLKQVE